MMLMKPQEDQILYFVQNGFLNCCFFSSNKVGSDIEIQLMAAHHSPAL